MSDPGAANICQLLTKAPPDGSSTSKEEAPARVRGNWRRLRLGRLARHMTDVPRWRMRLEKEQHLQRQRVCRRRTMALE